jgi:hypothetical protein
MTTPMPDLDKLARGLTDALEAVHAMQGPPWPMAVVMRHLDWDEDEPCPRCQTWTHEECRNGRGCPYTDGRNGLALKAHIERNEG